MHGDVLVVSQVRGQLNIAIAQDQHLRGREAAIARLIVTHQKDLAVVRGVDQQVNRLVGRLTVRYIERGRKLIEEDWEVAETKVLHADRHKGQVDHFLHPA